MKLDTTSSVFSAQGGNQEQIERLSPRLPGVPHPGMFEGSGPGNDGGTETGHPCVSYLINPANYFFFCPLWGKKYVRFPGGKADCKTIIFACSQSGSLSGSFVRFVRLSGVSGRSRLPV